MRRALETGNRHHLVEDQLSTDLLFYEAGPGSTEFYDTDGTGAIATRRPSPEWGSRPGFTQVVPGTFTRLSGELGLTDAFFYNEVDGEGEFWSSDWEFNRFFLVRRRGDLEIGWTQLVPGVFRQTRFTDLLAYKSSSGELKLLSTDGVGGLRTMNWSFGARLSWTHIVPGNFGPSP